MRLLLSLLFLIGTSSAFANDRRCFELETERDLKKLTGGTIDIELPLEVRTRADYKKFVQDLSGGGLKYEGVCGLDDIEILESRVCYQHFMITNLVNEAGEYVGPAEDSLPRNTVTDNSFRAFMETVDASVEVPELTGCEK